MYIYYTLESYYLNFGIFGRKYKRRPQWKTGTPISTAKFLNHTHTPNVEEEKDEKEIQKKIKYTLYVKCRRD